MTLFEAIRQMKPGQEIQGWTADSEIGWLCVAHWPAGNKTPIFDYDNLRSVIADLDKVDEEAFEVIDPLEYAKSKKEVPNGR